MILIMDIKSIRPKERAKGTKPAQFAGLDVMQRQLADQFKEQIEFVKQFKGQRQFAENEERSQVAELAALFNRKEAESSKIEDWGAKI